MKLLSVNIGQKRTQPKGNELETTGIYKLPTRASVEIKSFGISEDFICDLDSHGGPDQAIYIYGEPDYAWWSEELSQEIGPGTFGDNLTISELESAQVNIGDRLHIGSVILEVTAPRIPCSTLARRMGDPQFVKSYRAAERPGMYCRVIEAGPVQAGDDARLIPFTGPTVPALEVFRAHFLHGPDEETIRRVLQAPVAERARADFERYLRQLKNEPA